MNYLDVWKSMYGLTRNSLSFNRNRRGQGTVDTIFGAVLGLAFIAVALFVASVTTGAAALANSKFKDKLTAGSDEILIVGNFSKGMLDFASLGGSIVPIVAVLAVIIVIIFAAIAIFQPRG